MWCTRTRRQRQLSWDKFSKSAAFRRFPTVVYNALVRELLRDASATNSSVYWPTCQGVVSEPTSSASSESVRRRVGSEGLRPASEKTGHPDDGRGCARAVSVRAGPDGGVDRHAEGHRGSRRIRPVHLGDHVLSSRVHDGGANRRKADGHLWPEAVLHRGHPRVHAGVDPRRNEPDDEPANRLPGSPGDRWRGDHGQQLRGHR